MERLVTEWYSDKKNIDEMRVWEQARLKKWEAGVASRFPKGARVLDIGCGLGREAFALTDLGFCVTGVDLSDEVIRAARPFAASRGYSIPFFSYDGRTLPFACGSFDVCVLWSQTFGLLYGDEAKRNMLAECRRMLAPGGFLSFSGHDYRYVEARYSRYLHARRFFPYANTELYWETFLPEELSRFAAQAGFRVLLCDVGEVYTPEDGMILHCLCQAPERGACEREPETEERGDTQMLERTIDTYCGLSCADCSYREKCNCGGCIASKGHPFHGTCEVAECAKEKGVLFCGVCNAFPCEILTRYSYDAQQGDNGERIENCKRQKAALEAREK